MYTAANTFFTTKQVEFVRKKIFVLEAFYLEDQVVLVHVVSLAIFDMNEVHLSHKPQIALLKVDETPTTVLLEDCNIRDVFCPEQIAEL